MGVVGTCSASLKYKILLQDWTGSKPNLVLVGEQLGEVNKSSYSSSCVLPDGRILDEAALQI